MFFYPDVLDKDWWFILKHDPRLKHIFKNNDIIIPNEEDSQGDCNEERYVHFYLNIYIVDVSFYNCHII